MGGDSTERTSDLAGDEDCLDQETAYVTSIPVEAREVVRGKYDDGRPTRCEYFVGTERVGERRFYHDGALEGEWSFRNGVKHGAEYRWDHPGELLSVTYYENGLEHGTAHQWGRDGRHIGSYTMVHGTGWDLWMEDWSDGTIDLAEAREYVEGLLYGFEWWFFSQGKLSSERHFVRDKEHGIERNWNYEGGLCRGYPRYWVIGERVTKRQYVRAAALDPMLPPFRPEENRREREFPPLVAARLRAHRRD